jgi:hypothetical protein
MAKRNKTQPFRATDDDEALMNALAAKTGSSRSELLRRGLREVARVVGLPWPPAEITEPNKLRRVRQGAHKPPIA